MILSPLFFTVENRGLILFGYTDDHDMTLMNLLFIPASVNFPANFLNRSSKVQCINNGVGMEEIEKEKQPVPGKWVNYRYGDFFRRALGNPWPYRIVRIALAGL